MKKHVFVFKSTRLEGETDRHRAGVKARVEPTVAHGDASSHRADGKAGDQGGARGRLGGALVLEVKRKLAVNDGRAEHLLTQLTRLVDRARQHEAGTVGADREDVDRNAEEMSEREEVEQRQSVLLQVLEIILDLVAAEALEQIAVRAALKDGLGHGLALVQAQEHGVLGEENGYALARKGGGVGNDEVMVECNLCVRRHGLCLYERDGFFRRGTPVHLTENRSPFSTRMSTDVRSVVAQVHDHETAEDGGPGVGARSFRRTGKRPGAFIRLDAMYNISRHRQSGLAVERSGGRFSFFDCEGAATPYLCWRRTEAHAFIPQPLSLDHTTVDLQPNHFIPREHWNVEVVGRGLDTVRVHPFNSDRVEDWVVGCRKGAASGVDLIVSQSPDTSPEVIFQMAESSLAKGGDVVCLRSAATSELAALFERCELFGDFIVCLSRRAPGVRARARTPAVIERAERPAPAYDGLAEWISCSV